MIYLGQDTISKIWLGEDEIKNIWMGEDLIYTNQSSSGISVLNSFNFPSQDDVAPVPSGWLRQSKTRSFVYDGDIAYSFNIERFGYTIQSPGYMYWEYKDAYHFEMFDMVGGQTTKIGTVVWLLGTKECIFSSKIFKKGNYIYVAFQTINNNQYSSSSGSMPPPLTRTLKSYCLRIDKSLNTIVTMSEFTLATKLLYGYRQDAGGSTTISVIGNAISIQGDMSYDTSTPGWYGYECAYDYTTGQTLVPARTVIDTTGQSSDRVMTVSMALPADYDFVGRKRLSTYYESSYIYDVTTSGYTKRNDSAISTISYSIVEDKDYLYRYEVDSEDLNSVTIYVAEYDEDTHTIGTETSLELTVPTYDTYSSQTFLTCKGNYILVCHKEGTMFFLNQYLIDWSSMQGTWLTNSAYMEDEGLGSFAAYNLISGNQKHIIKYSNI